MDRSMHQRSSRRIQQQEERVSPLELNAEKRDMASSPTLAMNEAVARRKAEGKRTFHLGFGEATFPLHPRLHTALTQAVTSTQYAPVAGLPRLRQAIAQYVKRTRGIDCDAEQVIVGPGSKPLIYALLQILAGDVLVPVPSWVSYEPQARLAGRQVIKVATYPADAQRLTPDALSEALRFGRAHGANPRILVINSPGNPTGGMFSEDNVLALADWASEQGITIISDEIYAELAHGWRPHISPARFYPEGCIVTGGISKAFSAGGWRLGYAILPRGVGGERAGKALRALASEIWSSASTPVEEAAIVAFTPDTELEAHMQRSACLHGYVTGQLHATLVELGIQCPRPAGGFYLYPDFSPWQPSLQRQGITSNVSLAEYLLDRWDIATLPGVVFGEEPATLRLRLATSMLYRSPDAQTPQEQNARLWHLLSLADNLPEADANQAEPALELPELVSVQERWRELFEYLQHV
ncbi:MAG TPA: aminotransferase class I/II-fold pyridoxal phosphate-dependent enzyme [Ktedonobacteraceae bacterium]|nr:aminotransferase class I/II-fold pyridoxal phosphate-dependent enzyme [Ktedonobacteraceae bacterium]